MGEGCTPSSNPLPSPAIFTCFPSDEPKPAALKHCIALLRSCTSFSALKQIHAFSIRRFVPISHPTLAKHLIFSLVSLSSPMSYPSLLFSILPPTPDVFTFNSIIRGHAQSPDPAPAAAVYRRMRLAALPPDTHTYPFLLKAVAKTMDLSLGEAVHCNAVKDGFSELVFVQNSLVHMYASCGLPESAHKLFGGLPVRELVTWNSIINGFAVNGRPNEALTLFRQMGLEGEVDPDGFTMVSLLSACADLGALALGKRAHAYIFKSGLTGNLHVGNALVDLYAKCGAVSEAKRVFYEMEVKSVVSWTSIIVGLALNGFGKEAIELFVKLEWEHRRNAKHSPTEITFVGVLYACSHCGMVEAGFDYFRRMKEEYGIQPKFEHYGCMVDLLGRSGMVQEAYDFITNMPLKPNAVIWRTLLGSCVMHGHLRLAELARAQLVLMEPRHSGDYVLLSNLYAAERRWPEVQQVRRSMLREGVKKSPGHSLVEVGNCVHEFVMGDRFHPQSEEIYQKLEEVLGKLKLEGYAAHTSRVLADIEEEEKERALCYHSEKLAIAFALLATPPGSSIRVIKNLRVCADCHLAIKLTSKIYGREIIVRDRSRFHHFKDGFCSCNDYW